MSTSPIARICNPGEGEHLWVVEDLHTIKLTGKDTGGQFALFEIEVSPGKGNPPHVHTNEDEAFVVTEGTIRFWVDGAFIEATAGTTLYAARGVPHFFSNTTNTKAKMLVTVFPAGLEDFFRAIGDPATDLTAPPPPIDFPRLEAGITEWGMTLLPPPGH